MTRGAYVPLHQLYASDAKLLEAGTLPALVWPRVLALAAQHYRTDGVLTVRQLERELDDVDELLTAVGHLLGYAAVVDLLDALARAGLLDRDPGPPASYRVRAWLEWNDPAAEVDAKREARLESQRARSTRYRARKSGNDVTGPSRVTQRDVTPYSSTTAALEQQQQQHSAAAAAPIYSPRVESLRAQLTERRLAARWDRLDLDELAEVDQLVEQHGAPALVDAALREHRPDAPAAHARAWLSGWRALERPRPRLVRELCPVHPHEDARACRGCAADRKAAP